MIDIDGLKEVNDTFGHDVGTICSAEAHRSSATLHATTTCASVWVAPSSRCDGDSRRQFRRRGSRSRLRDVCGRTRSSTETVAGGVNGA